MSDVMYVNTFSLLVLTRYVDNDAKLYLIPNADFPDDGSWYRYLNEAHGKIINVDPWNDALKFIHSAVVCREFIDAEPEWDSVFKKYLCDNKHPIKDKEIVAVYSVGYAI